MLDNAVLLPKFTAPRLAGCALWLRADRGVTPTAGDGSTVSAWRDQSRGLEGAQATDANRPSFQRSPGARPAVRFAIDRILNVSGMGVPTSATFIIVLERAAAQTSRYNLSGTSNGMGIIDGFFDANTIEWFNGAGTDRVVFSATRTAGRHICTVTQVNGGVINTYYDGVFANTKATAAANLLAIGAIGGAFATTTNGMTGDVFEVIAYNRVLPAAALQRIHSALKRRYNTA